MESLLEPKGFSIRILDTFHREILFRLGQPDLKFLLMIINTHSIFNTIMLAVHVYLVFCQPAIQRLEFVFSCAELS